jgi:hypothetical protein
MRAIVLCLLLSLTGCDQVSSLIGDTKKEDDSLFLSIEKMYDRYNKKDLEGYCSFFSEEVNVFKESGLGNTRIITGKTHFKSFYENLFSTKKTLKVTPLHHFTVYPWIMVKELIELDEKVYQAAVGYRLADGKIRDRMILSENFLINKESLGIELPKNSSTPANPPQPQQKWKSQLSPDGK